MPQSWSSRRWRGIEMVLVFTKITPRRSSHSKEDWQELNWYKAWTLNITKVNTSVVEYEWFPPVSFSAVLNVESGTPIVSFCTSVAFFPQEHVVTCKPEQLHHYFPVFFQGLKHKSVWSCWKGRYWEKCLLQVIWEGIPWVCDLQCCASWSEGSFPDCSPKLLVPG